MKITKNEQATMEDHISLLKLFADNGYSGLNGQYENISIMHPQPYGQFCNALHSVRQAEILDDLCDSLPQETGSIEVDQTCWLRVERRTNGVWISMTNKGFEALQLATGAKDMEPHPEKVLASQLISKLQALVADRGDKYVTIQVNGEGFGFAASEFHFRPDDKFHEGQTTTDSHFNFRVTLRSYDKDKLANIVNKPA